MPQRVVTKQFQQYLIAAEPDNTSALLNRFGLHNANQVRYYLNSTAGKETLSTIAARFSEINETQEQIAFTLHEKKKKLLRLAVFRLLNKIHKYKQEQYELYDEELETTQHKSEKAKRLTLLKEEHRNNDEVTLLIEDVIQSHQADLKLVKQHLYALDLEGDHTARRFANLEHIIHGVFEQRAALLQGNSYELQAQLSILEREKTHINKPLHPNNQTEHQHAMHSISLKIALLHEISKVHSQQHISYNQYGKRTTSFEEAHFLVPKDKVLTRVSGKLHLYAHDAASNKQTDTVARQAYLDFKPQILSQKAQLEEEKEKSQEAHQQKRQSLVLRQTALQQQIVYFKAQLNDLKESQNTCKNNMHALQPKAPSLSPLENHRTKITPYVKQEMLPSSSVPSYGDNGTKKTPSTSSRRFPS